jgi:hypothetical protein
MLTAVLAEPAKQRAEVRRSSLVVSGARTSPGEFEYDLGAGVPVDRLNLELPDANEPAGGEARLSPPPHPFAWKNLLLWAVLVSGAAFLAWMAFRLARDFSRT